MTEMDLREQLREVKERIWLKSEDHRKASAAIQARVDQYCAEKDIKCELTWDSPEIFELIPSGEIANIAGPLLDTFVRAEFELERLLLSREKLEREVVPASGDCRVPLLTIPKRAQARQESVELCSRDLLRFLAEKCFRYETERGSTGFTIFVFLSDEIDRGPLCQSYEEWLSLQ